ncbi:MAG: hypothetical protein ABI759_27100 [Candidatus Solibacter sp.]
MFPIETLRAILALIGAGSAFMAGQTLPAMRARRVKPARHLAWMLRTALCLGALGFRHQPDLIMAGAVILATAAFAAGWWQASHVKPPEDLSQDIVPHDPVTQDLDSRERQSREE